VTMRDSMKIKRIERMTIADLDEVLQIENASFSDPWQRLAFENALDSQFSRALVARGPNGKIVAYTVYWIAGPECHILNIAVHPEMRRKGLGSLLMDTILEDARKCSCEEVVLEVRPSNLPAIALYQKYGFAPIGVRRRYYSNNEDAIVMRLYLSTKE